MTPLFSVGVEGFRFLTVSIDLLTVAIIIVVAVLAVIVRCLLAKYKAPLFRCVKVDSVKFGLDFPSVTIKVDRREQELAYALWVELGTRKAALPFDDEYDVIVEVYDSWYAFFSIARKLMREIPPDRLKGDDSLSVVTERILNKGLTRWQAEFRRWYKRALDEPANAEKSPQEIQRGFPGYEDLVADLKKTNDVLMRYRETLREIADM